MQTVPYSTSTKFESSELGQKSAPNVHVIVIWTQDLMASSYNLKNPEHFRPMIRLA